MRGGCTRDVPEFAEIREEYDVASNPARFLATEDSEGLSIRAGGETPELALAKARIRGIETLAEIRCWQQIEVELGLNDGGPRKIVLSWLNRRQSVLEEDYEDNADAGLVQERPDHGDSVAGDHDDQDADIQDRVDDQGEGEGENTADPVDESDRAASGGAVDAASNADVDGTGAVAADGGSDDPLCSSCQSTLEREELAGQVGYWCSACSDFTEPMEEAS
jgi:hypothetical protein